MRRLFPLIHAKKRSTTQRRGRTAKPTLSVVLDDGFGNTFMLVASGGPDMLDDTEEWLRHLKLRPASIPVLYER